MGKLVVRRRGLFQNILKGQKLCSDLHIGFLLSIMGIHVLGKIDPTL